MTSDLSIIEKVESLQRLSELAKERRSVFSPGFQWAKRLPAAVAMNFQGAMILKLFTNGLYVYTAKGKSK